MVTSIARKIPFERYLITDICGIIYASPNKRWILDRWDDICGANHENIPFEGKLSLVRIVPNEALPIVIDHQPDSSEVH